MLCAAVGLALLMMGCPSAAPSASEDAAPSKASAEPDNAIPPQVVHALSRIHEAELISLEPWADPKAQGDRLEGYLILGATKLSQDQIRAAGIAISSAVASFDGAVAACFDPRHALRFQSDGHAYVVLICFDCGHLRVLEDGQRIGSTALDGSPAELNKMLVAADVPISHSAEDLAARYDREQEANDRRLESRAPARTAE